MSAWSRLVGALRGNRMMEEIDEEIGSHLQDAIAAGRDPAEARRALGSPLRLREESRDIRLLGWVADLVQDLRFGCRMLLRSPEFSSLAILCLTLGIGANAAVFSWIEGILLRPYPLVVDQERLFAVTGTNRGSPGNTDVSWPDWLDLQRGATLVEAFIAEKITGTTLSAGDRAERASGSMVSANYFDAIGVRPILGRGFQAGEDAGRNAHPVTVISYQMWQDRFNGDPAVIGKTQTLNSLPHTIVGVTPKGFFGTFVGYAFQFWVPASMQAQFDAGVYKLEDRSARFIEGYVRPKPGVTIEQVQAELSSLAARLERDYPETNRGRGIRLFPLCQTPFNNAGALLPTLGIALVVVVSVLLIACANVGNLLLVRAFARHQEMTIRLSVGAGRGRLVKQLVTEGMILSALAAAGGLVVANWLRSALALLAPPRGGVLLRLPGELDWRVLAMSAGVSVAATLLFALVPAVLTSQVDLAGALRSESGVVGSHRRAWVRSSLVVIQVSLSLVLLVGAGLLIQSMQAIRAASPGFSADGVLVTSVDLFTAGYEPQRAKVFQGELVDRLQAIGGVQSVAFSRMTPFSYRNYSSSSIAVEGYEAPADQQPTAEYNEIGPGFLSTIGIPLASGREFTRADNETAPLTAIVDETMAAQFWPGSDPLGRRVQVKGRWRQVVGVARTAKYHNLLDTPKPFFYVPLRPAAPEFLADGGLADQDAARPQRDRARARPCDSRARCERGAGRAHHAAGTGGSDDGIATNRGHDSRDLRRARIDAGGRRTLRRDGCHGVAEQARAGAADCARGERGRPHATGRLERPDPDGHRRGCRRARRAPTDTPDGLSPLQGQPARSAGVCFGHWSRRRGCARRLSRARLARGVHRSDSSSARIA